VYLSICFAHVMDDCCFEYFSLPYIIILCIIPDFSVVLKSPKLLLRSNAVEWDLVVARWLQVLCCQWITMEAEVSMTPAHWCNQDRNRIPSSFRFAEPGRYFHCNLSFSFIATPQKYYFIFISFIKEFECCTEIITIFSLLILSISPKIDTS
jgi:hypothetical protein